MRPTPAPAREQLAAEASSAHPKDRPLRGPELALRLDAAPASIVGPLGLPLDVWSYNAQVPGPPIRVRVGQPLRIDVTNHLPEPTSVHWHGVRVPNAMDGVPGVTQPPIAPGGSFTYRFVPRDAGTFWYHSHEHGTEQVERGLYGPLIVEDEHPPPYSRELVWVLDDWRLTRSGQIDPRFETMHDTMHDGRYGNVVTVNGKLDEVLDVRPGERVRLRLLNAATARIFMPDFGGLSSQIIAVDGMYAARPIAASGFELAPGNRIDVDMTVPNARPGETFAVTNRYGGGHHERAASLVTVRVLGMPVSTPMFPSPAAAAVPAWPAGLEAPVDIELRLSAQGMGMHHHGIEWLINGHAYPDHVTEHLTAGRWTKLRFTNASARLHPMHLHGQFFKVLARNGAAVDEPFWRDTVLVHPREIVDLGIVPLDEGFWALHCHVLEHAEAGMMTVVEVAPAKE